MVDTQMYCVAGGAGSVILRFAEAYLNYLKRRMGNLVVCNFRKQQIYLNAKHKTPKLKLKLKIALNKKKNQ